MKNLAMRRARDFVALFNAFWYRDFPISERYKERGSRAEWTIHIGICVRSTADLLGFFTHFESGRTDAIIKDNTGRVIANIEWEWAQPENPQVNEIRKLRAACEEAEFSVFISYSRIGEHHQRNLDAIREQWGVTDKPLIILLVLFRREGGTRVFDQLATMILQNGSWKERRQQPALPWHAVGTRWESHTE